MENMTRAMYAVSPGLITSFSTLLCAQEPDLQGLPQWASGFRLGLANGRQELERWQEGREGGRGGAPLAASFPRGRFAGAALL